MRQLIRTLVGCAVLCSTAPIYAVSFVDVSASAGIGNTGETYGASWGDFDGDGYPDLWVNNHARTPMLYSNNQDGTFTDIAPLVWPGRFLGADDDCDILIPGVCLADTHGVAWIDFDNDGDQDLLEVVGGARGNHFFENDAGELFERAVQYGLHAMGARSRSTVWLDWNLDGLPDPVLTHAPNATQQPLLMTNLGTLFVDAAIDTGIGEHSSVAAYLADISEDGAPELILSTGNLNSGPVFSTSSVPFVNVAQGLSIPGSQRRFGCSDAVFEDFNGDLRTDVFASCGGGGREVVERNDGLLEISITALREETAVEFDAAAPVTVAVYPGFALDLEENLQVGASGFVPPVIETPELGWQSFTMDLDPANAAIHGTPPHVEGEDLGLFISFDPLTNRWRLGLSTPGGVGMSMIVTTGGVISNVVTVGFNPTPTASQPVYIHRVDGGFVDYRVPGGLALPLPCSSVVGADFDNDTDVDLYAVCSRTINNLENRLFLNDGEGRFTEVALAAGAAGSGSGSGDAVVAADYDRDGFLDLFVTNGNGGAPFNIGPHQLFRNLGNDNHWLSLDLVGTLSNRDALGSIVTIEAGGKAQRRMQDGGFHRKAQDHQRVHFGLGDSTVVDQVHVRWPSGQETVLTAVAADQIITVVESFPQDPDGDGVLVDDDNCTAIANADQVDTDADGYGNACDADFNNDCAVNAIDLGLFKLNFLTASSEHDFNGDGVVNAIDLGRLRLLFLRPVGPSGVTSLCDP